MLFQNLIQSLTPVFELRLGVEAWMAPIEVGADRRQFLFGYPIEERQDRLDIRRLTAPLPIALELPFRLPLIKCTYDLRPLSLRLTGFIETAVKARGSVAAFAGRTDRNAMMVA